MNNIKLLLAGACWLAGFFLFYRLSQLPTVLRVLIILGCVLLSSVPAYFTTQGHATIVFFREAYREVRKVVWPTPRETFQTALAIFMFALVVTIYVWLIDKSLEWVLYDLILGWRK